MLVGVERKGMDSLRLIVAWAEAGGDGVGGERLSTFGSVVLVGVC